jgi:hypothetical protein
MKSYSETDVFSPLAQAVHKLVSGLVSLLPDPEPRQPLWRCHEVARAVLMLLEEPLRTGGSGASLHVFDGKYGPPSKGGVEHSWLILLESSKSGVVLDPYAVGRLPQVQLIDWELQLACMYKERGAHNIIRQAQRTRRREDKRAVEGLRMKPQVKSIYERKEGIKLTQVALREDGQWFERTMSVHGDRPLVVWHKVEPPQNLVEFSETGRRALLPKDKKAA